MNALYGVYSLHISSSKIKLLLKICKGFTNSNLITTILIVVCSYFYTTSQFKSITKMFRVCAMLKLFLNNLICEVEMSVIRH